MGSQRVDAWMDARKQWPNPQYGTVGGWMDVLKNAPGGGGSATPSSSSPPIMFMKGVEAEERFFWERVSRMRVDPFFMNRRRYH